MITRARLAALIVITVLVTAATFGVLTGITMGGELAARRGLGGAVRGE